MKSWSVLQIACSQSWQFLDAEKKKNKKTATIFYLKRFHTRGSQRLDNDEICFKVI